MIQVLLPNQMHSANRAAILEIIRQKNPIARSEIGRQLGLSLPTVMRIVDELLQEGLVQYTGQTEWSSGRRRELLEYNKDGRVVIGIDLGWTDIYGAVANIGGEIIHEIRLDRANQTGEACFELLIRLIGQLLALPRREDQQLIGIAVGVPGVTHVKEGVVEWSPSLQWRDYPLKQKLEQLFPYPVYVDNDVNLAALGENWFGCGVGVSKMVWMTIGTGLGAGIIIDGALYRGFGDAAGEIGYMIGERNALGQTYDQFGAMEQKVTGPSIVARARAVLAGSLPAERLEALTAQDVFAAARRGEDWAVDIVRLTVDYLAMAIINVSAILDPELIVLGGGVMNSADLLLGPVRQRTAGALMHLPRLEISSLGSRATVMGGIAITVYRSNDYYMVHRLH